MKRKYKILICSMICFVLCFGMTITSYAGFYDTWGGDLDTDFDIESSYASSFPYYSLNYLSTYSNSNALPYDFSNSNQTIFQVPAYVSSGGAFTNLANPVDFYTSSTESIDVSGYPLVLCGRRGSGSNSSALVWHRVSGSAFISVVDNWLCSTESFTVYSIYNRNGMNDGNTLNSFCVQTVVDTVGSNGYYWFPLNTFFINGIVNASDFALMFTDFPIYLSTTSGNSGFSVYTDFSFLADNINYNYLLLDEIINDPQAPALIDPWWDEAKNYLNFRVSSIYGWESTSKSFTHNMNFAWNKDMMLNPDFYVLNLSYFITYKDDSMTAPETFYYVGPNYKFTRRLIDIAYLSSGTLKNKISFVLPLNEFADSNGETLLSYYLNTIHRVVGTNINQIDVNDFWEGAWQKLEEWTTFLSGSQYAQNNYKLTSVSPVIGGHIDTFVINGYVQIGRIADTNNVLTENIPQDFYSGVNVSQYDMLQGKNSVIDRSNEVNLYPPEEGQEPSVISPSGESNGTTISGGNHATAQGGNANVTINTADNPFKNWSPEAVESLKETWDTIKEELDAHKDNSFMALIVESYKIIPDPLWQVIILCGSVISIFAVVRFIRNR